MRKRIQSSTKNRRLIISASEIAEFSYCSHAWYLKKQGYKPQSPSLEIGKKAHKNLGDTLDNIHCMRHKSKRHVTYGIFFLVTAVILILIGVLL